MVSKLLTSLRIFFCKDNKWKQKQFLIGPTLLIWTAFNCTMQYNRAKIQHNDHKKAKPVTYQNSLFFFVACYLFTMFLLCSRTARQSSSMWENDWSFRGALWNTSGRPICRKGEKPDYDQRTYLKCLQVHSSVKLCNLLILLNIMLFLCIK